MICWNYLHNFSNITISFSNVGYSSHLCHVSFGTPPNGVMCFHAITHSWIHLCCSCTLWMSEPAPYSRCDCCANTNNTLIGDYGAHHQYVLPYSTLTCPLHSVFGSILWKGTVRICLHASSMFTVCHRQRIFVPPQVLPTFPHVRVQTQFNSTIVYV